MQIAANPADFPRFTDFIRVVAGSNRWCVAKRRTARHEERYDHVFTPRQYQQLEEGWRQAQPPKPEYQISEARHAKGKLVVHCHSDTSYKTRAARLIGDGLNCRYSGRERGYIATPSTVARFEALHRAGWDANVISGDMDNDAMGIRGMKWRDAVKVPIAALGPDPIEAHAAALEAFDARYKVEDAGAQGWQVRDTVERSIEFGPVRYQSDAVSGLAFMRAHVGVTVRDVASVEMVEEADLEPIQAFEPIEAPVEVPAPESSPTPASVPNPGHADLADQVAALTAQLAALRAMVEALATPTAAMPARLETALDGWHDMEMKRRRTVALALSARRKARETIAALKARPLHMGNEVRPDDVARLTDERDRLSAELATARHAIATMDSRIDQMADTLMDMTGRALRAETALAAVEARQARARTPYHVASVRFERIAA